MVYGRIWKFRGNPIEVLDSGCDYLVSSKDSNELATSPMSCIREVKHALKLRRA